MGRLYWRQVGPNYLGIGKLVAHLDGPSACPSCDVEDAAGRIPLRQRREIVPAVEDHLQNLELVLQALRLRSIVGIMVGYALSLVMSWVSAYLDSYR
jgi:hypothetical protein